MVPYEFYVVPGRGPLPSQVSEAFTLRTYPFREADLIVSFFTRDQGKLRGAARRARKLKSSFGSGLERLSRVNMMYFQRESVELVRLDGCDLLESQFRLSSDYPAGVVLDHISEITDHLLPPHEPNEKFFRLLISVLQCIGPQSLWPALTYFDLWAVRLTGILPSMRLSEDSQEIAREMLVTPLAKLSPRQWTRETAADLRRQLLSTMEAHIERRLITAPLLHTL